MLRQQTNSDDRHFIATTPQYRKWPYLALRRLKPGRVSVESRCLLWSYTLNLKTAVGSRKSALQSSSGSDPERSRTQNQLQPQDQHDAHSLLVSWLAGRTAESQIEGSQKSSVLTFS